MEKIIRFLYPEEQPDLTTFHSLSFRTNRLFPSLKKILPPKTSRPIFFSYSDKETKENPDWINHDFFMGIYCADVKSGDEPFLVIL